MSENQMVVEIQQPAAVVEGDAQELVSKVKTAPKMEMLKLGEIQVLKNFSVRTQLRDEILSSLKDALADGVNHFPPLSVFFDGERHILADGHYRYWALKAVEISAVECAVYQGSWRDAWLFSVQANASHGVRLSNTEKRAAVTKILQDEEWLKMSDYSIADLVRVSRSLVQKIRRELESSYGGQTTRIGRNGRQIETAGINGSKGSKERAIQARAVKDEEQGFGEMEAGQTDAAMAEAASHHLDALLEFGSGGSVEPVRLVQEDILPAVVESAHEERMRALLKENGDLRDQLETRDRLIAELQRESLMKDEQIAGLKAALADAKRSAKGYQPTVAKPTTSNHLPVVV